MRYESEVTIDAPADQVWRVLADVPAWPEWTPTMRRVENLDGEPLREGGRFRVEQPRLRPAVWTVSTYRPGRSFAWTTRTPGLRMCGDHRVEAAGSGTRVALSFEFTGPLAPLVRVAYGRLIRGYVRTEGASLKRRCESPTRERS